jgi:hypothetical protein
VGAAPDVTLRHTLRTNERGRSPMMRSVVVSVIDHAWLCEMCASQEHRTATDRSAINVKIGSQPPGRPGPRAPGTASVPSCGGMPRRWPFRGRMAREAFRSTAELSVRCQLERYVTQGGPPDRRGRDGEPGRAGESGKARGAPPVACGRAGAPGRSIPDRWPPVPSLSTVASPNHVILSTPPPPASTAGRRTMEHGRPRPPHRYYGDDGVRRKREDTHQPLRPRSGSLRTSVRPDLPSPVMRPRAMRDGVNPT